MRYGVAVKGAKLSRRMGALAGRLANPRRLLRSLTAPVDELTALADRYGSDKGSLAHGHHYTRVYSALFSPLRERPVRLLEIGLLGLGSGGWDEEALRDAGKASASAAPSLRMWSEYFPQAELFGADLNDFSGVDITRTKIFQVDAGDAGQLLEVAEAIGGNLDVILDDASHASRDQQVALGTLFPRLRSGGIYVIEDLFFQPPEREMAGATRTVDMLRKAEVSGRFEAEHLPEGSADYLHRNVARVALFDSLSNDGPIAGRDALGVLWKK